MEDNQIVDLFLGRDQDAISQTAKKYGPRLRAIAANLLSPADAEECENDTYLQAWNAIPPHEPRDYLFPFLAKLTRRLAISVYRSQSRKKRSAPLTRLSHELEQCIPASGSDTQGRLDGILLAQAVGAYLRRLPEDQRNIFIRRYWFMDPIAKIAARYGYTQSKVKTTLYRARSGLKAYLNKEGYDI